MFVILPRKKGPMLPCSSSPTWVATSAVLIDSTLLVRGSAKMAKLRNIYFDRCNTTSKYSHIALGCGVLQPFLSLGGDLI